MDEFIGDQLKCLVCGEIKFKCGYCLEMMCGKHSGFCCLDKGIFISDKQQLRSAKKGFIEDFGFSLESHDRSCISALVVKNSNDFCFSGGDDWSVRIWEFPSLIQKCVLYNHDAAVTCLCISSNDQILISGSSDCTIKLKNLTEKKPAISLHGHKGEIISLHPTQNDQFCISGSSDKTCRIWNLNDFSQVKKIKQKFFTKFLRIVKNDESIVMCTTSNTLIIWELNSNSASFELERGHYKEHPITCMNNNTEYLALGLENGEIHIWDLNSWQLYTTYKEHKTSIQALALAKYSNFLLSSDKINAIIKWDLSLSSPFEVFTVGTAVFNTLTIDPTDTYLLSSDLNRDIKSWKLSENLLITSSSGHKSFVYCCWVHKNSSHLLSVDDDNTLISWNLSKKSPEFSFQVPEKIQFLTCSPVQSSISYLTSSNTIYILNPTKPPTIQKIFPVSSSPQQLKFTKSEKYLSILITSNNNKILQIIKTQAEPTQ